MLLCCQYQNLWCEGMFLWACYLDVRWARCCLVERQGCLRQHCRLLSNSTERGRRTDKHELQKGPFPSRIFLPSLAELSVFESNSATRPVPGILSRWPWTGGWTGRLGREWWLVPDYTSGCCVPFTSSSSSSPSPCHMPGMAAETGCFPVTVLQQCVKLFSNMTLCSGRA